MFGVFFANVLDTKIVDGQGEDDVAGFVLPEGGSAGDWMVSECGEVFRETIICNFAGLFETGHSFLDFHVYVVILYFVVESVSYAEGLWDEVCLDLHVLEAVQRLLKNRISGAPVVDAEGNYLGIFSEKCLLTRLLSLLAN